MALREALSAAGNTYKAVVAISAKKMIDGVEHTEDTLNGSPGVDIAKKFKTDQHRILVVADKFLTGFDEPMLTKMYVDKK